MQPPCSCMTQLHDCRVLTPACQRVCLPPWRCRCRLCGTSTCRGPLTCFRYDTASDALIAFMKISLSDPASLLSGVCPYTCSRVISMNTRGLQNNLHDCCRTCAGGLELCDSHFLHARAADAPLCTLAARRQGGCRDGHARHQRPLGHRHVRLPLHGVRASLSSGVKGAKPCRHHAGHRAL